jgi:hypothetical protein
MVKLKNLIVENIESKLKNILLKVNALPDTDRDDDLFQKDKNYKFVMKNFFNDLLRGVQSSELVRNKILNCDLNRDPYEIFRDLNSPQSDVRNALILWSNKLDK